MSFRSVSFNPATGDFEEGHTISTTPTVVNPTVETAGYRFEYANGESQMVPKVQEAGEQGIGSGVFNGATNNGVMVRHITDVRDSTLVTVGGLQMAAKSAAELGLIARNADGSYSEVPTGEPIKKTTIEDKPQDLPQESDPYNPALSSGVIENALESCAIELGNGQPNYQALDRHALSAISGMAKGDLGGAVGRLASSVGVEPGEAEAFIAGVFESFRTQAGNYINTKHGVNAEDVFNWAEDYLSTPEKSALYHSVYLGRSGALDKLTESYKKHHR